MKFDLFIARKFANFFHKYIKWRTGPEHKLWNELFKNNAEFANFKLDESTKLLLYRDSVLSHLIFDGFEKSEQQFISNFLKQDDVFFDIGSNIGLFSIIAARVLNNSGHVYAFEPANTTYSRLTKNVEINNFSSIITTVHAGISNSNEKLALNTSSSGYDAWNSFVKSDDYSKLDQQEQIDVIRLDEFILSNKIDLKKIKLVKIDVEGWELMVFQGLEEIISDDSFHPCFIVEFTEENTFRAGYSSRDLYNYMLNKNYEWFEYHEQANTLTASPLKAYYPYENLVAVKKGYLEEANERLKRE